jgi:hypothetical protein
VLSISTFNPSFNPSLSSFQVVEFTAQNNPLISLDGKSVVDVEVSGETHIEGQGGDSDTGKGLIEQSGKHTTVDNLIVTAQGSTQVDDDGDFLAVVGIEDEGWNGDLILTTQRL